MDATCGSQARIASPLISLLQQHNQAVDPNLTQLAEAWKVGHAGIRLQGLASPDSAKVVCFKTFRS